LRKNRVDKNKIDDMRDTMKCNSFSLSKIARITKEYDINMEVLNEKDMEIFGPSNY
jgi:hypothetical protein